MGTILFVVAIYLIAIGCFWVACERFRPDSDGVAVFVVPASLAVAIFSIATAVAWVSAMIAERL